MIARLLLVALTLAAAPVLAQTAAGGTSPASVQAQIAELTAPLLCVPSLLPDSV